MSRTQRYIIWMRASATLLCYPIAEQLGYHLISILKSTMIRGMNTIRNTSYISSVVEGLPCVKKTSDGFANEGNRQALRQAI
eukprot:8908231-Pyramimonas_sp.AAC.1